MKVKMIFFAEAECMPLLLHIIEQGIFVSTDNQQNILHQSISL